MIRHLLILATVMIFTGQLARAAVSTAVTETQDQQGAMLAKAQALGAPMVAVKRALALTTSSKFPKKDVFAVFDISQPSKNKRLYVFDVQHGKVASFYVAHGKSNGDNFRATKFRGFQEDHDMTPLGPMRTAETTSDMEHYATVTDRYTGRVYTGLTTLWLEGVTSYNSYINNTFENGSKQAWIIHPAWYVAEGFRQAMPGGLGRSLGCIALDPVISNAIAEKLKGGALFYVTVGDDAIEKYL